MIGRSTAIRHGVVGGTIAVTTGLAALGVLADPDAGRPERFDAKTVVVAHDGADGVRITEYVDIDFGGEERRGYLREVPNDFGAPIEIVASSPDAADDLAVTRYPSSTEIRIGDPDRTWTGQHRYELSYTLPDARFDELADVPFLFVDIVAPADAFGADPETGRFEVIVTGFELGTTRCDLGQFGIMGGCELVDAGDGTYRVVLEPLAEGDGLSVGGTIERFTDPVVIESPPLPERRGDWNRGLVALGFLGLGLAGAVPVYLWSRRRGRNEVFVGGAADAAYGALPPPGSSAAAPAVRLVPDEAMGDLATTEFAPPDGLEPWEGSVLLRERVDDVTVQAWLSGLAGREALQLEERGANLLLSSGPRRAELEEPDAALLGRFLALGDPYTTGKYDAGFSKAWSSVRDSLAERIGRRGWWKRPPPGASRAASSSDIARALLMVGGILAAITVASIGVLALASSASAWQVSVVIGVTVPAIVALLAYRSFLPARTARGSALALRAESFRRFLHASEAQHVEWAWSKGLLREYSAWAVALGEADAWTNALERANVPEPARMAAVPMAVHRASRSLGSSRTAPSSSGSGGGGFGGGGVGGGGGGGRSGSW